MQVVRLASEIDFAGWREAARTLRAAGIAPEEAIWTVGAGGDLFDDAAAEPRPGCAGFTVPRGFMGLAEAAVLHRSDERFALLYRLLWRLGAEPALLEVHSDPDVQKVRGFTKAVATAEHKMRAFVRFRQVPDAEAETYVAWFEPAHRVTQLAAPFFVRRFANMRFSLLTPDACAHWDTQNLVFGPGADPAQAPREDGLEDFWRTYYAAIFNPARLNPAAMQREMPKRYWRNLPEASLIPELIERAESRTAAMVAQSPSTPSRRVVRAAIKTSRDAPYDGQAVTTLDEVAAGVQFCRRCDLYKDATQGVAGEGPAHARLMLVGEQPGDQEDLAGHPFVGPAGIMLDKALIAAGVPREGVFVTNAVKHFRHELRGKKRIHKTPGVRHVDACRWWLDNERRIVRPRVIVAMGATAVLAVFGEALPVGANRGQARQLPDQAQGLVTWHPSFLLRVPDAEARAKAFAEFVDDLKLAWKLAA
ncbi:MAG TPA: UdgX family uracil-DNA binding protein [Phenylobacterium sp.]